MCVVPDDYKSMKQLINLWSSNMFIVSYHEKVLLAKLVDAYELANLSDAEPDGKDFWIDLSSELCSTVCMPLEKAMMAILKAYSYSEFSDWVACGMPMNQVEVLDDIQVEDNGTTVIK